MIDVVADVKIAKVNGAPPVSGSIPTCRLISQVSSEKVEIQIAVESEGSGGKKYEVRIDELQRALDTIKAASGDSAFQ